MSIPEMVAMTIIMVSILMIPGTVVLMDLNTWRKERKMEKKKEAEAQSGVPASAG